MNFCEMENAFVRMDPENRVSFAEQDETSFMAFDLSRELVTNRVVIVQIQATRLASKTLFELGTMITRMREKVMLVATAAPSGANSLTTTTHCPRPFDGDGCSLLRRCGSSRGRRGHPRAARGEEELGAPQSSSPCLGPIRAQW